MYLCVEKRTPLGSYAFLPRPGDSRPLTRPRIGGRVKALFESSRPGSKEVIPRARQKYFVLCFSGSSPPFLPAPFPRWVKGVRGAVSQGPAGPQPLRGRLPRGLVLVPLSACVFPLYRGRQGYPLARCGLDRPGWGSVPQGRKERR